MPWLSSRTVRRPQETAPFRQALRAAAVSSLAWACRSPRPQRARLSLWNRVGRAPGRARAPRTKMLFEAPVDGAVLLGPAWASLTPASGRAGRTERRVVGAIDRAVRDRRLAEQARRPRGSLCLGPQAAWMRRARSAAVARGSLPALLRVGARRAGRRALVLLAAEAVMRCRQCLVRLTDTRETVPQSKRRQQHEDLDGRVIVGVLAERRAGVGIGLGSPLSLFRLVADGFDVVAVGIEHERAVVGRVILGRMPGAPLSLPPAAIAAL